MASLPLSPAWGLSGVFVFKHPLLLKGQHEQHTCGCPHPWGNKSIDRVAAVTGHHGGGEAQLYVAGRAEVADGGAEEPGGGFIRS